MTDLWVKRGLGETFLIKAVSDAAITWVHQHVAGVDATWSFRFEGEADVRRMIMAMKSAGLTIEEH